MISKLDRLFNDSFQNRFSLAARWTTATAAAAAVRAAKGAFAARRAGRTTFETAEHLRSQISLNLKAIAGEIIKELLLEYKIGFF